jgi:hypothetical protein
MALSEIPVTLENLDGGDIIGVAQNDGSKLVITLRRSFLVRAIDELTELSQIVSISVDVGYRKI